jgi:hypothetical protein
VASAPVSYAEPRGRSPLGVTILPRRPLTAAAMLRETLGSSRASNYRMPGAANAIRIGRGIP